jgi:type IV secretion system protein VirB10
MSEMNPQSEAPKIQDKRLKIPGIVPKNAQTRLLGGIALIMVVIIWLSGRNTPKPRPPTGPATPLGNVDPNQARIQEFQAHIAAQASRLAEEEAQLAETKRRLAVLPPAHPGAGPSASSLYQPLTGAPQSSYQPYWREEPQKTAIELDREKREYQAQFASNIALSYRSQVTAPTEVQTTATGTSAGNAPTDPDRRSRAGGPDPSRSSPDPSRSSIDLARADGKKYRLFEGKVIETVLTNRLDSNLFGPASCMVTTTVYSHDRQHVLIPQGTRVLGEVRKVESFGEQRVACAFHRLIMPDGFSVNLDKFQGLNQIGETGLRDQVNHHYMQIFGVSLAIGAIAGLAQSNTQYGFGTSASDVYRQGVATSLSQSSLRILDRYLNVLPTYTIREGHRVNVYLSQDLLLPAYDQHEMPGDI